MMQMLSSTGPVNWEIARQTAEWVALEGRPEPAIDAADRKQFEELVHAAQTLVVARDRPVRHVRHHHPDRRATGLGRPPSRPRSARCSRRSRRTLGDAMRAAGDDPEAEAELSAMLPGMPPGLPLGDVLRVIAPALLGVQAGSMIGYLAQHAFGRYDLPLPTGAPPDGDEPSLLLRGAERRRVRGGVDAPTRRPALLPRAPRGGARGRAFGSVGAVAARAPRGRVRLELRDRPDGVRGGVRRRSIRATRRRSRR